MVEDEACTPTHRRRSSSIMQTAGGQTGKSSRTSYAPLDGDEDRILEEPDAWAPTSSDREDFRSDEELDDDEETGLTHTERKKRRRRKQRNRGLDERVVGDGDSRSPEERLVAASMLRNTIVNALLIGLWYSFSISISVYNKWMFSKDNLDFHFPLFTTSIHMVVQFTLASAVLFFIPRLRPSASRTVQAEASQIDGAATNQNNKPPPVSVMTRWFYLTRIGPCGTATALDIGLGNFSLRFISLTFFTMCKSSTLGMVLLFAFLFRLEKPTWRLCAIILVMTVGVVMMVAGETAFNTLGFALVMTASFCSGFRWSLTQILLLRNPATSNPFSSIFFLTPVMFAALIVLALPIEGPAALVNGFRALAAAKGALLGTVIIIFPGCLAFLMVAAEFALLKRTSVVTLSVCGIFKEVLTISAAGLVFGDELSPINISGLIVTIASIAGYNYVKYTRMKQEAQKEVQGLLDEGVESVPLRSSSEYEESVAVRDEEGRGRESTSGLMRDNLSLVTDTNGSIGKHLPNGIREGGVIGTSSPVK